MNAKKGYYSLIQFCPDVSRLESVNLGVVLFCPDARFIAAKISRSNKRAAKLVGRAGLDRASLTSAKRALAQRFEVDRDSFNSLEDFQRFVDTRGNALKLTAPRPVKIFEPTEDLSKLYAELVGGIARYPSPEPIFPELDSFFLQLQQQGRAKLNWDLTVPVVGRPLHVPYAYRNGVWNLVKPQRFSSQEAQAVGAAMRLAIEGDLLHNHETADEGKKNLIVVSTFDENGAASQLQGRVQRVLEEYHVKTVPASTLSSFLAQVDREAHS